jgi:hypothetical protein
MPATATARSSRSFANGIEVVRTIRNDLTIEGADPGLARATGQVTSRFADTLRLDDARTNAAVELEFEHRISDTRRLTVTLHEASLSRSPRRRSRDRPAFRRPSTCAPPTTPPPDA